MNPSADTTDAPPSARTARHRYRHTEGSASRLRLLTDAGLALAAGGSGAGAAILARALAFLSMDEGLLLYRQDDGLHVHAAQGAVYPVGACLPLAGALHAASLENALPQVGQDVQSRLRIGRACASGLEVLLPMLFGGRNTGVLALIGTRRAPPPNADDLEALQVLATMLAAAQPRSGKQALRTGGAGGAGGNAAPRLAQLTTRELQVFALMPRGLTNAAMAAELGIAAGTVKVHIERILHKLGLRDRTQAAVCAVEHGYGA
ncbi:LuxR family transcriptional regulator [Massilia sp. Root418]|uniref:LuxR C-terminal-related transcriptional regulator n=1 Tax=Massilia sp. Root418 TaxID=1736532 RepID=UPI00070037D2|nr:LuxR C-terminal-related transcriptional regulator [Massilia sp. Root418]KQX01606.1 LuxR family transcriptional regulator [Massilia sp. Root418]